MVKIPQFKVNTIKFDPERIAAAAAVLEKENKRLTQNTAKILKKAEGLAGSWSGVSADAYLERARALDAEGLEISQALQTFSVQLREVSGIYQAGESGAKQEAEGLPTDGVFLD